MNTDYMMSMLEGIVDCPRKELEQNKDKYSMGKEEVVIGLGRPRFDSSLNIQKKRAYPAVITNLARMDPIAKNFLSLYHSLPNPEDGQILKNAMIIALTHTKKDIMTTGFELKNVQSNKTDPKDLKIAVANMSESLATAGNPVKAAVIASQIKHSLEFFFVGIALGRAYAHPNSGDTVASVMIGGLRTILNGPFPVHTNDLLMFILPGEEKLFENGAARRIDRQYIGDIDSLHTVAHFCKNGTPMSGNGYPGAVKQAKQHKDYYNRGNGNYPGGPDMKINTFVIIPFLPSRPTDGNKIQNFPMDKMRVWGRAISNAQPFEMMDVQLGRQAI